MTHYPPSPGAAQSITDGFQFDLITSNIVYEVASKGMYTYIKHFALNDQENYRGDSGEGVATWSNEQTIREIYLKPFGN